jgi:hypothetical protein
MPPLPSCVLFAIWALCPQMAIGDTFRHVPYTFLHVPCPWFTFRILPPLSPTLSLSLSQSLSLSLSLSLSKLEDLSQKARACFLLFSLSLSLSLSLALSKIYTFLYVPCNPPIKSLKWCPESIRSSTFRATLPLNHWHHVLNLYVPIRSVQPSRNSVK